MSHIADFRYNTISIDRKYQSFSFAFQEELLGLK